MDKNRLQGLIGPDYTLQWTIGHGGMSTVWLADDNRAHREVAIKVLRPEFSDNEEFLSRFRNEAETAQCIHSENVVETYDYRELVDEYQAHFCFMALEYIRGESLADLLARDKQLPEALALDIMEQAAHGLADIHAMGMVHRDIKPGNLLITQNGQVKITDFGIAKAAAAVPLTRTGMVVGTAQYVSPEQAQGQEVTTASDVYSLGVVGYEMLAGKRPFSGDSSVSVALAHISQAPEPLPTTISAEARELIGICLRKDPATRYPQGTDLAAAVSNVRFAKRPPQPTGVPVPDTPPSVSMSAVTSMISTDAAKRNPRGGLLAFLAAAVLGAAGIGAVVWWQALSTPDQPPTAPQTTIVTAFISPAPLPRTTPSPVEPTSPLSTSPASAPAPAPTTLTVPATAENEASKAAVTTPEMIPGPVTVTQTHIQLAPAPAPGTTNREPDPSPPKLPSTTPVTTQLSPTTLAPLEALVNDLNEIAKRNSHNGH